MKALFLVFCQSDFMKFCESVGTLECIQLPCRFTIVSVIFDIKFRMSPLFKVSMYVCFAAANHRATV